MSLTDKIFIMVLLGGFYVAGYAFGRLKTHPRKPKACAQCGQQLGDYYRLDGEHNGQQISFCSFTCHDAYMDAEESQKGEAL